MSYNLLADSAGRLDWEALRSRLLPEVSQVELFPIPGRDSDSIGISIPAKAASEARFQEACRVAQILREEFGMTVFELYSSSKLTSSTEASFRRNFLA